MGHLDVLANLGLLIWFACLSIGAMIIFVDKNGTPKLLKYLLSPSRSLIAKLERIIGNINMTVRDVTFLKNYKRIWIAIMIMSFLFAVFVTFMMGFWFSFPLYALSILSYANIILIEDSLNKYRSYRKEKKN